MKKTFAIVLSGLLLLGACSNLSPETQQSERITIAASFYPLAEFARNVGGDKAEVFSVTPEGAEPHDYEPAPRDIAQIQEADLLILNGGGQDPWGEKIQEDLRAKGVMVLNMSEHFDFTPAHEEHEEEEPTHTQETQSTEEHEHEFDPHIWLDPILAGQQVKLIRDHLIQIDPANRQFYTEQARAYIQKIADLDQKFKEGLANCRLKDFVTSHAAFGYLASRYGLNQLSIAGISPEAEPSARQLAELSKLAKEKEIKHIFFETLVSPKLAETVATEIGAQTLVLNPIEGLTAEDVAAQKNYVTLMEENLRNLRTALNCQ